MRTVSLFLLMYLAAVSQVMVRDEIWAVNFSAVVVVLAVKWFSPAKAASLAFVMGLLLDGLGSGPLGAQAATLVVLAAMLSRWGFAAEQWSVWRWMWAVFLTSWSSAAICAAIELVPDQRWEIWERALLAQSLSAGVTAVAVGMVVGSWRQLTGTPCTTH